jgi:hypothetical protein
MSRKSGEEKWRDIIRSCRASGITVKKWCTENNINFNTYRYWFTRINKSEGKNVQWAEVTIPPAEGKSEQFNIQTSFTIYLNDFSIKIEKGFDGDTLAELLKVLRAVC